jgi:hypothetical protein
MREGQEEVVEEKGGFEDGEEVDSKNVVVGIVSNLAPDMEIDSSRKDVFPCCSIDSAVSSLIRDTDFPTRLVVEIGGGSNLTMADEDVRVVGEIAAVSGSSGPVIAADLICTYSGTWPGFTQGRVVKRLCGRSKKPNKLALSV